MENAQKHIEPQIIIQDDDSGLDFKKLIYIFLQYWPWFLLSVFICMLAAFLYMRYATPVYKVSSKILIKDDNGGSASSGDMLSELNVFNTKNNVNNEKQILQTHYLIQKVVNELQLNVSCFAVGNIKSTELYKSGPFKIKLVSLKDSISTQTFNLSFSENAADFMIENDSLNNKYSFNDTIRAAGINFIVQPTGFYKLQNDNYQIIITSIDAATRKYLSALAFQISDKQASVLNVTLEATVPKKGEDILNKIYEVYTRMNEEDKDKIADSTMNFINERLALVSNELSGVEKDIEKFKENNRLSVNIPEQASMSLSNANDIQKQLTQQDVQISVVQSIWDHLKGNSQRVVPNAAGIQDPTYISTVQQYNALVLERDRQLETSKPDNPIVQNLNSQIAGVKSNLLVSLDNITKEMQITRDELAKQNAAFLREVNTVPAMERAFLDISRQQDIKQQLYLYLLQKREETAISKSGTMANSRLIEPGKSEAVPFTPVKSLLYFIALGAGILIPSVVIYFKNLLNNTVTSIADIEKITQVPILGEIGNNVTSQTVVAKQNSRTALAEQFRALRTNMQFLVKGKSYQVIMFTSSTSGEGKTFLTINLGAALAISNRKVVLIELDLRKPKVSSELNLSTEPGFSNYLISNYKKEDIIKPVPNHPNLFIISAGTIPPNPADLLLDNKVGELFTWLKTQFDFILVDTPPVGAVIDAVLIGKYADASVFVVRQGYTLKEQLHIINNLKQHEKLSNLSILVNDVRARKTYGYGGYGYGYGNGYGYGYYSDDKKQKRKFFRRANRT